MIYLTKLMRLQILYCVFLVILALDVLGCSDKPERVEPTQISSQDTFPPPWTRTVIPSQVQIELSKTPTVTPVTTPSVPATAQSKNGQLLKILIYSVGDPADGNPTYKMGVVRNSNVFWLKATESSIGFGCEHNMPSFTYGCYGGTASFVDMDGDGEPEVVSLWEHDGSCGSQSFHLHHWNGHTYELIKEDIECGLRFEVRDLNDNQKREVLVRYNVGPKFYPTPWLDIYALTNGELVLANKQYPGFYAELLSEYERLKPDYAKFASQDSTGLEELLRRTKMAETIVGESKPR